MHDLVIRNGTVVDGTGRRARRRPTSRSTAGAIARRRRGRRARAARDRRARTCWSRPAGSTCTRTTTARSPGIPMLAPSSWHGVTTLVMGNCGVGFAPRAARAGGLPHRADGRRRGHPRHRAARGHRLALGVVPRVPRRARPRCRACSTSPRRCRTARCAPTCSASAPTTSSVSADEIAEMARLTARGAARRRRRLLHLAHHPAPLAARPRAGHALDAGGAARASAARSATAGHGVFEMVSDLQGQEPDLSWMMRVLPQHRPRASPSRWRRRRCSRRPGARRWRASTQLAARGPAHRAAGAVPADRHALRPAELAASVHHRTRPIATSWPRCRSPSASRACAIPRCAPACSPRSRRIEQPDRARPDEQLAADLPARRSARLRAAAGDAASPPPRRARGGAPRRSSTTGCSSATAASSCSRRWPTTSTATSTRCAR